jgi:TonB family protein
VEGRVVVQFVVTEEGQVQDPIALSSPDPRLSRAAIDAVRRSRFEPGRIDGEPVRVRFSLPVDFALR